MGGKVGGLVGGPVGGSVGGPVGGPVVGPGGPSQASHVSLQVLATTLLAQAPEFFNNWQESGGNISLHGEIGHSGHSPQVLTQILA